MSRLFSRLAPRLQEAIVSRLGWTALRPVQELAGQAILGGQNAVILAPTAGGKTEASMFPALSLLLERPTDTVGLLYIAPIKALLNNQAERLGRYTEMVGLDRLVWHGDTGATAKRNFQKEPCELLMTTPESLEVMLISPKVQAESLFQDLRLVIIDEVHALAGTDRGAHLMSVIERLAAFSRNDVQRLGLSATVGNPEAILDWLKGSSERPGAVIDPPKQPARRELLIVHRPALEDLSEDAAQMGKGHKSLFFCQSRAVTEAVAAKMREVGTEVFVHHSSVSLEEREAAERRFHRGRDVCIACTSTLELGIDVGDLDKVFQAEAPDTVGSFLQRMGRTGRRTGTKANTSFFCSTGWTVVQAIALIELARRGWVEEVALNPRCWPVLVHQSLAMALSKEGVRPREIWQRLSKVPDFSGISTEEYKALIQHLIAEDYLYATGGLVTLGDKAERIYGRKNFMELYAVFSSPQNYRVETRSGKDLGTLDQAFVDRLEVGLSAVLLAGRSWTVWSIDHRYRRIKVAPSAGGKRPRWGGYIPQFLSFELCREMRALLCSDQDFPYLHPSARDKLEDKREQLGSLLRSSSLGFEVESGFVSWWTFAGGRVNNTLKLALPEIGIKKVSADNFCLNFQYFGHDDFTDRLLSLSEESFWRRDDVLRGIRARLPAYRLSKFQDALPLSAQREVLEQYLLDVPGACRVAGGN